MRHRRRSRRRPARADGSLPACTRRPRPGGQWRRSPARSPDIPRSPSPRRTPAREESIGSRRAARRRCRALPGRIDRGTPRRLRGRSSPPRSDSSRRRVRPKARSSRRDRRRARSEASSLPARRGSRGPLRMIRSRGRRARRFGSALLREPPRRSRAPFASGRRVRPPSGPTSFRRRSSARAGRRTRTCRRRTSPPSARPAVRPGLR
jgi:hypothetical protein